ncbi:MAG: FtsQ-type POTRA domain-containing protein [Gemmatimonadaceae bacterium]|nr:FtsQ-type POTRA domain-containing protein [Gemmatimonadaceae bacterium]
MTGPLPLEGEAPRTTGKWKLIALIVLLLLIAPASWLARRGASKLAFFHLRTVSVEGTRYLKPETVMQHLALDTTRSVWDDTGPLAVKLRLMSQVSEVRITRKLPGTLVVTIRENLPVALAPSPRGLEAVDGTGTVLPIDPTRDDLDLPIAAQRDKSILSLLADARARNPMLFRRISEIARDGRDGLVLSLVPLGRPQAETPEPSADSASAANAVAVAPPSLRVRASLGVSVSRLADIFPVESDLLRRRANVAELDLRYRDQVIARLQ